MTPTEKHRETARSVLGDWMVGEHPQLVGIFAVAIAKAEREGMKRAAEIARGSSGEFDFQSALGEGRDFDYGFHNGKNHAADSILATIIIDKSNSPDSPLVGAKAGEAGSHPSSAASPAPYSPWHQSGFNPDKVG